MALMAAREHGIAHDVEQTEKMVPFITSETAFRRVLSSFRHGTNHNALSNLGEKTFEMATRIHRETHDIEHTQEVIPFIFREISFGQNVSELVFGIDIFDLDF